MTPYLGLVLAVVGTVVVMLVRLVAVVVDVRLMTSSSSTGPRSFRPRRWGA
jgi:hypothetical protein